ncbi:expressed unknown protein [Ectocarpus siliculosus]|uniref:Uncharacterized protein n=1 Tax=Ectocarpus siliculosus TaxID=2880 RepID=D7G3N9_ECTSI|nr:expressed unknown protein [Ectocarpus siliculosus]|eukprot:CBJ49292.1 expressed unknown protein [Ectocarpus siliculosus]
MAHSGAGSIASIGMIAALGHRRARVQGLRHKGVGARRGGFVRTHCGTTCPRSC